MSRKFPNISFCIPVYNEEKILLDQIKKIKTGLVKNIGEGNFEMIVVNNASSDNTRKLLKKIHSKYVHTYTIEQKGIGAAFRYAIRKANYNYVVLSAIDLPFGFTDLVNATKLWCKYDLIYGSKAHDKSLIYYPITRKISSAFYRLILKFCFHIPVKDTQGSVFLKKNKVMKYLSYCDSKNAFFTAQLAIYGTVFKLKIAEVSVSMKALNNRKSKYNIIIDGLEMFYCIIREFIKMKQNKIY